MNRVLAIGKTIIPMARAVEDLLGDHISDGLVMAAAVIGQQSRPLSVIVGGRHLPNAESPEAASNALKISRHA